MLHTCSSFVKQGVKSELGFAGLMDYRIAGREVWVAGLGEGIPASVFKTWQCMGRRSLNRISND
jgi:hypothetical protein